MCGELCESTLMALKPIENLQPLHIDTRLISTKNGWVVLLEPFNPNGNQNVLCPPYPGGEGGVRLKELIMRST